MICDQIIYHESKKTNTRSSLFYIDGVFQCQTIENLEKSIPLGIWELKRREELTPLTRKYLKLYPWFDRFAEIQVPNRSNCYLHIANKSVQLEGCVAPVADINVHTGFGSASQTSMRLFYDYMNEHLKKDSAVYRISHISVPLLT